MEVQRGTVYISRAPPHGHWARFPDDPEYSGNWQVDDPKPHIEEEGPGWDDVEEAIAWGRERASRVVVILAASDQDYSAGEERVLSLPEWPHQIGGGPRENDLGRQVDNSLNPLWTRVS